MCDPSGSPRGCSSVTEPLKMYTQNRIFIAVSMSIVPMWHCQTSDNCLYVTGPQWPWKNAVRTWKPSCCAVCLAGWSGMCANHPASFDQLDPIVQVSGIAKLLMYGNVNTDRLDVGVPMKPTRKISWSPMSWSPENRIMKNLLLHAEMKHSNGPCVTCLGILARPSCTAKTWMVSDCIWCNSSTVFRLTEGPGA